MDLLTKNLLDGVVEKLKVVGSHGRAAKSDSTE